jgi:hypothetical protein
MMVVEPSIAMGMERMFQRVRQVPNTALQRMQRLFPLDFLIAMAVVHTQVSLQPLNGFFLLQIQIQRLKRFST